MKGSIKKRGSTYSFVVDIGKDPVTGKRRQKRFSGYKTKKEAQTALATVIHELEQGSFVLPAHDTLKDYLNYWISQREENLSPTTVYGYKIIINNHLVPSMGAVQLKDLKPLMLNEYYSEKLKTLSGRTVLHHHRMLRKALQDAVGWQLIKSNPCDAVEPPKATKYKAEVLDIDEIRKLINALKGHKLEVPVSLMLFLGLRRGELLALKWSDIDFEKSTITIQRNLVRAGEAGVELILKEPKTEDSIRSIPLSDGIVDMLEKHKINQKSQKLKFGKYYKDKDLEFVFTEEDGSLINPASFSHRFGDFLKENGLKEIRLHDLRHTNATIMLMSNIPAKVASQRLGHSNISTTLDIYSHVLKDMEKDVSEKISDIIFDAK